MQAMDTKTSDMLALQDAPADSDNRERLPWAAPVLKVYDAARLTLGSSDQTTDIITNTHS